MRDPASKRDSTSRRVPAGFFAALFFLPACTSTTPKPADGDKPAAEPGPQQLDLWAGVPPIEPAAADIATELTPVPGPQPPPTVSEKVELPFPPPEPPTKQTQDRPPDGPLKVLRTSPTQKQPGLVNAVTAVFNHPMVPLASIDDLKLERSPLSIEPQPKGKFRWLGTQMIAFEPDGRLPFSTTYTARVQAGETSELGAKLTKEVQWQFTTPGLEVETHSPGEYDNATLDTLMIVRFNQAVDRAKIAAALRLKGGGKTVAVESIAPDKWETLAEPWRSQATAGFADRTLVLKPLTELEPNTGYAIEIPAGVYGEGPNASKAISLKYRTYPPLTLSGPTCSGDYTWDCRPESGIQISASNPIVSDPAFEKKVRITPEVPDLKVTVAGGIHLEGKFRGLGTYTIEVDAGLRDIHGQELKTPYRRTVTLPALDAALQWSDRPVDPAVLEPGHSGVLEARATGLSTVEVRARTFDPSSLREILNDRTVRYDGEWPGTLSSGSTWDKTFDVRDSKVEAALLGLDVRAMGAQGGKFLLLGARSNQLGNADWRYRASLSQLVQITRLGVTAALDSVGGVIYVTDIETGEPLSGVELALHNTAVNTPLWSGKTGVDGTVADVRHGTFYDMPYLLARYQGDVAYVPLQQTANGQWGSWTYERGDDEPRIFFYTERQPYKPGETVHLQGIVREESRGPAGKVELWRASTTASYTINGPRGHEVAKGEVKISPFGTFSVEFAIPAGSDTGTYNVHLTSPGGLFSSERSFYHQFEVQEYRAPEFEVKVERAAAAPLIYGDTLAADIKANYLHGAPMVGAQVSYTLRREDTPYRPPGGENEGFTFGQGSMFWWGWDFGRFGGPQGGGRGLLVRQGNGQTDARGVLPVSHVLAAVETAWGKKPRTPDVKKSDDPPGASTYTLEANVVDENRQSIAGRSTYVVHPASEYAGVRSDRTVYKAGERAKLEAVVVDVDGKRIEGREIALRLVRKETSRTAVDQGGAWSYKYETVDVEVGTCAVTSAAAPVGCELVVDKAGSYDIKALISDPKGRKALSVHPLYVYGDDAVVWQQDQRRVDVVPDKRSYEPGETATLLLRSPFDKAKGLVVVSREGIVSHRTIDVVGGAAAIDVPIDEAQIPGVHVSVILVRGRVDVPGAPPGQDLGRPAYAVGDIDLKIEPTRKKIALEVAPETLEVAPKETLKVTLRAKDYVGAPQKAAVAVMVVDEGVLSLMGFKTPDPLTFFHHDRGAGVSLYDLRQHLVARKDAEPKPQGPAQPDEDQEDDALGNGLGLVGTGRGGGGAGEGTIGLGDVGLVGRGGGGGAPGYGGAFAADAAVPTAAPAPPAEPMAERAEAKKEAAPARMRKAASLDANMAMSQPISLRSLFATTAYFNAEVQIDATGEAKLEIPMPENLTSFRIMAVAVDPERADRFGSAEAAVKVRKPIMLRPSLPRFTNFGDKFEASVMVDNQTSEPQAILVGTRGTNVVLSGETTVGVEIPAGQSKEVRFPMAVDRVGTMRLQFAALSNGGRDATEISLPVLYPATRQAFADYGVTSQSVLRTLKVPADALAAFGGLELSMSSTALTGLEDAVDFLVGYRYECTEQLASRLLPIFVLGPVLEQFPIADLRDLTKRQALGVEGLARIRSRQNYDGGFRYWDEAARSSPYLTAWVTFAMLEGKKAEFKVEQSSLDSALTYLENFVRYGEATPWGRYYDHTSRAFALWLLSREGRGSEMFEALYAKRKEMPLYAHAQLMSAAHRYGLAARRDALLKEFRARVVENAKTAHFAERASEEESYGLQVLMHSNVQTDAIALMALLEIAADDPLLPKVMAGIMDDRDPQKGGQWGTTHANAWALLAASRYFTTIEKEVPDYVARIWLDTTFAGERAFKGRSMSVVEQEIPMKKLLERMPKEILLSKDGPGLLYYRLGLRYAPKDLMMKPESQGFTVHRSYEPLAQGGDAPDPNSVKKLPDGTWEIKAGALVRVNLTLVAKDRANFVVVDDPLPAGLEGQNAKFATTLQDVDGGVESQSSDGGWGGIGWGDGWWWWRPWWRFDHTQLKDDRMLLFADHLPAGVYTYSYTARATTIGEFTLPPVRAEAMYMPELFGHGASSRVRVVE